MDSRYITVCMFAVLLLAAPVNGWTWDDAWCFTKTYGGTIAVGVGAVAVAPLAVGALGFGSAGIAAGSVAAKMMAASAAANGGGVVAGGVVATFQSVGAAGLGLGAKTAVATAAGGAYRWMVGGCNDVDCEKLKADKHK